MLARYLQHATTVASFLSAALAQDSVPSDLRAGFASSGIDVQASYTNDAVDGFKDGTTFEKDAVKSEPTFALGDSSGISPQRLYTIIMVDTTCDDKRTLHFARANYKFQFDITEIATDSAPFQVYKAPGSFGETGDDRKYSFLMYDNPEGNNITTLSLPNEGDAFDVNQFQDDNGFEDAVAGLGMVAKLGGQTNCDGQQSSNPSQSSSVAEEATSSIEASASTTAASATASATVSRSSSGAASRTTGASQTPNRTLVEPPEPTSESASDIAVASSVLATGGGASTLLSTSVVPDTSATGTATSSGAALETDSGASELVHGRAQYVVAAGLIAFAAL
ncbi:hypothetical protein BDV96DRAFT_490826 [Lophiotrema nucula]|uniref:Uncharacterized protein n=1 Tax=Lophiotrema nucula TaxID=690887 RepID=A0A6A5ZE12_9PLEO|nr:hypothetical protein BDV96DRAFT_490826 [Lophiotrema nucula]